MSGPAGKMAQKLWRGGEMLIQNSSVGFLTRALSLPYTQNNPSLCFGFPQPIPYRSPAQKLQSAHFSQARPIPAPAGRGVTTGSLPAPWTDTGKPVTSDTLIILIVISTNHD
ncbi:MAG: hypothetical protein NTV84_00035 [Methanoregula sp.]|nr:hypothetical protein [Methanoregula sp.]